MIAVQNVSKRFGGRVLFSEVTFRIGIDDRVALVGPNGAGKTTLLEMIAGKMSSDTGSIAINKNAGVGYLTQDIEARAGQTALEAVLSFRSDLAGIEHHLRVLEEEIASAPPDEGEALLKRYGELQARFEQLGGYSREARAREILGGLGFRETQMTGAVESLSGGWRMRTALAGLLLSAPDILLLDEPTNHLDLESVIWLEEFLENYPGAILLISHDRSFMNRLVSRVIELDGKSARAYTGNYDRYIESREQDRQILEATAKNQQKKIDQTQAFIEKFRYKATKARQVQSRVRMIEKLDRVEIAPKQKKVRFRFPEPPRSGKTAIRLEDLDKS
ncbi:MAG TPA: ABC-F family ATP-binding cassette domain-containing protein, partial [Nitrospiria bacterium]|nr:ABC-F family ATP-binding cassette domain-containing protein [Nitrospiria bacterium]